MSDVSYVPKQTDYGSYKSLFVFVELINLGGKGIDN